MNVIDKTLQFAALFDGRKDAYGSGNNFVVHEPVTARIYQDHLEGKKPIGIFPVREDNTMMCGFSSTSLAPRGWRKPTYGW